MYDCELYTEELIDPATMPLELLLEWAEVSEEEFFLF